MKPLSPGAKRMLKEQLVEGRLRRVAKPLYHGLLEAELGVHRLRDASARPPDPASLRDVTAMIKTFERPRRLRLLVDSIRRLYPGLEFIVIDDGREPRPLPGVETHVMPYDSGLGAGRNLGLSRVKTRYVLTLDDDFMLYHRTGLSAALALMDRFEEIDIMGGMVVDLPLYIVHDYRRATLFPTGARSVRPPGSRIGSLEVYDKVADFFLARTDRLRLVEWDPGLKRLVHADFFSRARGVLTTVFNPDFRTLHVRDPFDADYLSIRHDTDDDLARLAARYAPPASRGNGGATASETSSQGEPRP